MWVQHFFGDVTTAHGINQVFKEHNGVLRRLFWACAFCGCFIGLFFFVVDSIITFIDALTATQISTDTHDGLLPMITVCNLSPIRCACQAFYDPVVLASDKLVAMVLPYICSSLVAFQQVRRPPLSEPRSRTPPAASGHLAHPPSTVPAFESF